MSQYPLSPIASGNHGLVCTACPEAVNAGLGILARGGKAADAAVATLLTLCVTKIGSVCIGGEAPTIVYDAARKKTLVLNGQGTAPMHSGASELIAQNQVDPAGIESATVPAVLGVCISLLREWGTMSFSSVAEPVLEILEQGQPSTYFDTSLQLTIDAGSGRQVEDKDYKSAAFDWAGDLANTLRSLAAAEKFHSGNRADALDAVENCFYRGLIGEKLAQWYCQQGALLSDRDLGEYTTRIEDPVTVRYRNFEVSKCGPWTQGPWTQGPWLCQCLKILEGFPLSDLPGRGSEYHHLVIESMKLAMADYDFYYGDPDFVDVPLPSLLSDRYTDLRRNLIESSAVLPYDLPGDPVAMKSGFQGHSAAPRGADGTAACIVTDTWGNVVVITPSGVGSMAGSGGRTGITHGTRLTAVANTASHPNSFVPGKRPCITPSPSLVFKHGLPWLSLSSPGGLYQDQVALQAILGIIHGGIGPDQFSEPGLLSSALIAKRKNKHIILLHRSIKESVRKELEQKGHELSTTRQDFLQLGGALVLNDFVSQNLHACGPVSGAVQETIESV